jgi:hypothetical protein
MCRDSGKRLLLRPLCDSLVRHCRRLEEKADNQEPLPRPLSVRDMWFPLQRECPKIPYDTTPPPEQRSPALFVLSDLFCCQVLQRFMLGSEQCWRGPLQPLQSKLTFYIHLLFYKSLLFTLSLKLTNAV